MMYYHHLIYPQHFDCWIRYGVSMSLLNNLYKSWVVIVGEKAVFRALRGRIPQLKEHDANLLANYLFHITVAPPSNEFVMNSLLEPIISKNSNGVFAREPIVYFGKKS
mmetsp:Transcript_38458/g.57648  ORF Transcript_38458/g.57648 Transcript_38458/m.57648 type:complete len:108 (-) Transcript_38458:18-341(-)